MPADLRAADDCGGGIAKELFLSVRTVDQHVSRIFAKLGVNSRAAATSHYERNRMDERFRQRPEL